MKSPSSRARELERLAQFIEDKEAEREREEILSSLELLDEQELRVLAQEHEELLDEIEDQLQYLLDSLSPDRQEKSPFFSWFEEEDDLEEDFF
jgi:hypothetical protein